MPAADADRRTDFRRQPHQLDQLVAPLGVFHRIDCCADADGHRNEQTQQRHHKRIHKGRHHGLIFRGPSPCKQLLMDMGHAGNEHIGNQEQHYSRCNDRCQMYQQKLHERHGMMEIAHPFFLCGNLIDFLCLCHHPFLLFSREKQVLMMRINTNSTTPVAIRASRCKPDA